MWFVYFVVKDFPEVDGAGGGVGVGVLRCGGGVLVRGMIVRGIVWFSFR